MERKELIKITTKGENQTVSARELYEKIGYNPKDNNFTHWARVQLENVDAIEGKDFTSYWYKKSDVFKNVVEFTGNANKMTANGNEIDYEITVEIAKEICMVVGANPRANKEVKAKSKEMRRYFIECEKQLKTIGLKANLLLAIYNGGQEGIAASKKLTEMEVAAATQPLLEENKELKIQTQKDKEWFSIKRVAMINNTSWKNYKWKDLKNAGIELGYTVKKVFDANYGEVNAYHIDVWKKVYPEVSFSF